MKLPLLFATSLLAMPVAGQDGSAPVQGPQPQLGPGSYQTFGTGCQGSGNPTGIVLPAAYAAAMGNSNNYYPFGRSNMRYQQVFRGSELGGPKVLTGFMLRQTNTTTGRPGGQQTIEVILGTTTYDEATITSTYASNFNTSNPPQSYFKGTINVPTLSGQNNDPSKFAMTVQLSRPFVATVSPTINLLMEVQNTSTSDITQFWDSASGTGVTTTRLYATTVTATTGTLGRNYGVIMSFLPAGSGAVPALSATGRPVINTSFSIDLSQAKASTAAVLIVGASKTQWGALPLPLDLTPIGASGCSLLCSVDVIAGVATDASGNAKLPLAIPNDKGLVGLRWFNQFAVIDQVNTLGLAFSNGGEAVVGDS